MKNYYSLLMGVLLSAISYSSIAQVGWTIYDNTNTNLSSGTYKTISIDQTGNIWVGGSYTGLFKFNGTTWTKYSTSNSNILHTDINDIVVDNTNKVWTANYKGISVFNGTNFTNYDTLNAGFNGATVYALAKDPTGKIWISSKNGSFDYKGITTFDGTTWTNITGYPNQINGAEFSDYAFASNNDVWLACNNGFAKYNGTFTYYPPVTTLPISQSTAIDASGNVWVGGFAALVKYNGSTWTKYDNVSSLGLPSNTLYYDILADGNILWIGTSAGLLKFDRIAGTILANYKASNSPLEDNSVLQIKKDANGKIWLATTIGIVKMDPTLVGVEELSNSSFSICPNPSAGVFNFSHEGDPELLYKIYSMDGAFIKGGKVESNAFQVDLLDAANGMYFMQIIADKGVNQVVKLVKG